jgi:hypothetical protein
LSYIQFLLLLLLLILQKKKKRNYASFQQMEEERVQALAPDIRVDFNNIIIQQMAKSCLINNTNIPKLFRDHTANANHGMNLTELERILR